MSQHESKRERLSPIILGPSPTHAERARTLVEMHGQGTLCTLMPETRPLPEPPREHDGVSAPASPSRDGEEVAGYPYGSIVNYVLDGDGHPILLTSAMAEHTVNFKADPRASLFVHETGGRDVLALGRVTLLGRIEPVDDEEVRQRYLQRHPESAYYAHFADFAFYRLRVEAIRYIGGFGRMSWTEADAYARSSPDPTVSFASAVIAHMNDDHADGLIQLCLHPGGLEDVSAATMKAVDCHGFEMRAMTPQGPRLVRLGFDRRVETPEEVRAAMIRMLEQSRKAASGRSASRQGGGED